jgi:hypothetical protein
VFTSKLGSGGSALGNVRLGQPDELDRSASESLSVALAESASIAVSGTTPQSAADDIGVGVSESASVSTASTPKTATDTLSVGLTESAAQTESVPASASDSLTVSLTESASTAILGPIDFGSTIIAGDSLRLSLAESATVQTTAGATVTLAVADTLAVAGVESAFVLNGTSPNVNDHLSLSSVESASVRVFATGIATISGVADTLAVALDEGFTVRFTGDGTAVSGTTDLLGISLTEAASASVASTAAVRSTQTAIEVSMRGIGTVLATTCGIEVIYKRIPARTYVDHAWPSSQIIEDLYPPESYVSFSFTC